MYVRHKIQSLLQYLFYFLSLVVIQLYSTLRKDFSIVALTSVSILLDPVDNFVYFVFRFIGYSPEKVSHRSSPINSLSFIRVHRFHGTRYQPHYLLFQFLCSILV